MILKVQEKNRFPDYQSWEAEMLHRIRIVSFVLLAGMLILAACGTPTVAPLTVSGGEAAGEGEGAEAPLVTYTDAAQGFSIAYPQPWTQDTTVTDGVKFTGGDDSMTLAFVTPSDGADAMTYAKADATNLPTTFTDFKQVGLAASTEVKDAIVLGFEASGTSTVTGKAYTARGDRYYMPLSDGRIAVLTVIGPTNHYDREGVRDIALTFRLHS
jgi:hypothetical protein